MTRHKVNATTVAREVVKQAERLPKTACVDLVGDGSTEERITRFADRIRRGKRK
jgi:hypothetical protein